MENNNFDQKVEMLIADIDRRVSDKILEPTNAELLKKLIRNADDLNEAISIAELGTTYKRTGLHFDKRLEKMSSEIKYFKKNETLSFHSDDSKPTHKLVIGDNYEALQNLLIQYKGLVDVIYIDPPYGKDSMGEFANTNYQNAISRDNLLSMLYPRLILAKQLLSENGVIFCSIDDKNHAYIKCLMDEIFGERAFVFDVPRITKKGGKSTKTIAKNHDYILGYSMADSVVFGMEDVTDMSKYKYEDKFVNERGRYALTQTLDYNSLQYSTNMDYEIEIDGRTFIPGGDIEAHRKRLAGDHGQTDWVWRWSKEAVKWGIENELLVVKNNRIYTKQYEKCRKKNQACELIYLESLQKAYTSLTYTDNKYSNDNGKKELDTIFGNGSQLFKNPKPTTLIRELVSMACPDNETPVVLDFFAGSGSTAHAILDYNKAEQGNGIFILCQLNEITDTNPNGIAYDVTSKRLKRIMTGECYDGNKDFKWIKDNAPYGGNLEVVEIESVADFETTPGKTPFDVIDETLYGLKKFENAQDKIKWVCTNFRQTRKSLTDKEI